MVGPGEVDADLTDETAGECEKFGSVVKCVIHEEKSPPVHPHKAVRIFVQFKDHEAAVRGTYQQCTHHIYYLYVSIQNNPSSQMKEV